MCERERGRERIRERNCVGEREILCVTYEDTTGLDGERYRKSKR